jgi:hypothetical protein
VSLLKTPRLAERGLQNPSGSPSRLAKHEPAQLRPRIRRNPPPPTCLPPEFPSHPISREEPAPGRAGSWPPLGQIGVLWSDGGGRS